MVHRGRFIFGEGTPSTSGCLPTRGQRKLQGAYPAASRLMHRLSPAHTTFHKILGYSGYGVAALFGFYHSTERENRAVVKAGLRTHISTGESIKTERANMTLMAGAKHVVQRTLVTQFPWPKTAPERFDYVAAVGRGIINLTIFLINVATLCLFTPPQVILHLIQAVLDWFDSDQVAEENADTDANADNAGVAGLSEEHPQRPTS
jgi:hypothetical protein